MSEDDLAFADPLLACTSETKSTLGARVPLVRSMGNARGVRINASTSLSLLGHRRGWTAHDDGGRCHAVDRSQTLDGHRDGLLHVATDGPDSGALASGRVDGQPTAPGAATLGDALTGGGVSCTQKPTTWLSPEWPIGRSDGSPMASESWMSGRPLIGSSMPWAEGTTSDLAECVLAPNPSAWTLDGTNTWIVGRSRGRASSSTPGGAGHDVAVGDRVNCRNNRAMAAVLTHSHIDHAEGLQLARYFGVPLHTWDATRLDEGAGDVRTLRDNDVLEVNGPMAGPSLITRPAACVLWRETPFSPATRFSGEHGLVAHPDGRLAVTASLHALAHECREHEIVTLLPGHGPPLDDPDGVVERAASAERLDEISAVMKAGASTVEEIVDRVYADIPVEVRPAAIATVRAQTEFLDNA